MSDSTDPNTVELRPAPYGVDLAVDVALVPRLVLGEMSVPLPDDADLSGFRFNDVIVDGDEAIFKFIHEEDGSDSEGGSSE